MSFLARFSLLSQARIALLEGERRSFDNVKLDLMRRIKMLEYALRLERSVSLLSIAHSRSIQFFGFSFQLQTAFRFLISIRTLVETSHSSEPDGLVFPEGRRPEPQGRKQRQFTKE